VITKHQLQRIGERGEKQPPSYPAEAGSEGAELFKVPAAWLIEQAGFSKGYRLGRAGVSSRHTLALTNADGATAAEVLALAARIVDGVESRFGVRLEMEPVRVGF
jgi:UDP-N-acetylmuramate dehydrogenase